MTYIPDPYNDKPEDVYEYYGGIFRAISEPKWRKAELAYMHWHGKTEGPFKNPHDYNLSMRPLFKNVNMKYARDTEMLEEVRPYWPIIAKIPEYRMFAEGWSNIIQSMWERAGWEEYRDSAVLESFMGGQAAILPYWKVEKVVLNKNDMEYDRGSGEIKFKPIKVNQFSESLGFKFFPAYDFCFDPSVGFDIENAQWAWAREFVSAESIADMLDLNKLSIKIEEIIGLEGGDAGIDALSQLGKYGLDQSYMIQVDYLFLKNGFKMWVGNDGKKIVKDLDYNPFCPGRIPLCQFIALKDPIPTTSQGVSDNEVIGKAAFHLDRIYNTIYQIARQMMNGIWVYDRGKGINIDDLYARAGGTKIGIDGPVSDSLAVLRPPGLSEEGLRFPAMISQNIDELTNSNPTWLGQYPDPKQQTGVVQATQQAPDAVQAKRLRMFERSIKRLGEISASVISLYCPINLYEEILGHNAMYILMDPATGQTIDPAKVRRGWVFQHIASNRAKNLQRRFVALKEFHNQIGRSQALGMEGLWQLERLMMEAISELSQDDINKVFGVAPQPPLQANQAIAPPGGFTAPAETVIGQRGNADQKLAIA